MSVLVDIILSNLAALFRLITKLLTIFFDGGVFSPIFDDPQRRNYGWDPKKFEDEMMARTTSIIMQNLVEIAQRTSA